MDSMRIFVSHSHKDNAWCRAFIRALRARDADVWYDEQNLDYGTLRPQIEREMLARPVFIAVFTPNAVVSKWVQREIDGAISLQDREPDRIFLPIIAARCDIPPLLSSFKWLSGPGNAPLTPDQAADMVANVLGFTALVPTPSPTAPGVESMPTTTLARDVFAVAITDLYDEAHGRTLIRLSRPVVISLLLGGLLTIFITGYFGYRLPPGIAAGSFLKQPFDMLFREPWPLFLWLFYLVSTLKIAILRNRALRGQLTATLVVNLIALMVVGITYYVGFDVTNLFKPFLELFVHLPQTAQSPYTYATINFGILAIFWVDTLRRWVRRARGLPLSASSSEVISTESGELRQRRDTPLNELVAGDLIVGAALALVLALVFRSSVINFFASALQTRSSGAPCTVSWPIGPCFNGGTPADPPTLYFIDLLQSLIYLPLGVLAAALSATLKGLEATAEPIDHMAQSYAESLLGTFRSALSRSLRPSFSSYFTALSFRNVLWPLLDFIAMLSLASAARAVQQYFHLLSEAHSCGNAGTLPCTYVTTTLLAYGQPYTSLAFALVLGATAVLATTFATTLLIFRLRVAENTLRFLGAIGFQGMVTYWIFAAALAMTNLILLTVGVSSRMPFLAPEPLAIASLASVLLVGQRFVLQGIRAFYQASDSNSNAA
jgi:hypothetical protein